ncbi:MAG TPA: alpha/beta fold hydrolase [Acidimicrobiales bacterium]|nr:alpha/beta fold hydrolase [Acidimicrobiales bacterium]
MSERLDVRAPDGTPLAVWVDGDAPALVLVHGCPSEHTTFDPLVAELRPHVTSYAMDRRGSGASGDVARYAIEREFEDVAAVVEAVAARTGGPVALWGHGYGCNPAMGGAALSANVHHLVLYEPSFGLTYRRHSERPDPGPGRAWPLRLQDRPDHGRRHHSQLHHHVSAGSIHRRHHHGPSHTADDQVDGSVRARTRKRPQRARIST